MKISHIDVISLFQMLIKQTFIDMVKSYIKYNID